MGNKQWDKNNKDKVNAYRRKWYAKNRVSEVTRLSQSRAVRKDRIRDWVDEKKSQLACEQCKESHPGCLDFHHVNPKEKEFSISEAVVRGISIERIEREMLKCKLLCSNCHRKLHWEDKLSYRTPSKKLYDMPVAANREHPTVKELSEMLWQKPTTHIAKMFDVSDKAVDKWAKKFRLSKPPRGYWAKNGP